MRPARARRAPLGPADLRGVARLAVDATLGLTDLVEAVHERVARLPGWPAADAPRRQGRTGGITGLVYRSVRGVTRLSGAGVDALLGQLNTLLEPAAAAEPLTQREALLAALNGVLGDHLAATSNPLAIPMAWRVQGQALSLQREALAERLPDATEQLLVLIHGLCMNDLQWSRQGHDHGQALGRALGMSPVYLHYNSGRHISTNGAELARLLERLVEQWPRPLKRVVLLGHSMGGLLARSALHQAAQSGHRWPGRVSDLVCLGTPHHGAPLERAGHWIDILLDATPYAAPFARLGRIRSAGITDLRHGKLLDEDWAVSGQHTGRTAGHTDTRRPVPLPPSVRCFAVAATIGQRTGDLRDRLLGDGLVPLDSALGRHADPQRQLGFADERQLVVHGIHHLDLLSDAQVQAQLLRWLGKATPEPARG